MIASVVPRVVAQILILNPEREKMMGGEEGGEGWRGGSLWAGGGGGGAREGEREKERERERETFWYRLRIFNNPIIHDMNPICRLGAHT